MTNRFPIAAAAALLAISGASFANIALAMPVAKAVASEPMNLAATQTVQWRGGGWRGGGWRGGGWGFGPGFVGGAIAGGLLAAPYYSPGPYYSYPGAYYPAPGYDGPPPRNAVAYCLRRFKSYDPRSGTYLGYDGFRHPCP